MAATSQTFWGVGSHTLYHEFGDEVVVAVYDSNSREQIEGAIIKIWYGYVEVLLPTTPLNGCRVVVVG